VIFNCSQIAEQTPPSDPGCHPAQRRGRERGHRLRRHSQLPACPRRQPRCLGSAAGRSPSPAPTCAARHRGAPGRCHRSKLKGVGHCRSTRRAEPRTVPMPPPDPASSSDEATGCRADPRSPAVTQEGKAAWAAVFLVRRGRGTARLQPPRTTQQPYLRGRWRRSPRRTAAPTAG